jgi:hypothetical protein
LSLQSSRGRAVTIGAVSLVVLVVALVLIVAISSTRDPSSTPRSEGIAPSAEGGVLFGVHHQQDQDTVPDLAGRLGRTPAVIGAFVRFPFDDAAYAILDENARESREAGAALLLTLEPHDGLDAVGEDDLAELRDWLAGWNDDGLPVLVRYAHEMNGSWYPWGQQPGPYVESFRAVADAVRDTPDSQIMWAPNEGTSYPYEGRSHLAERGSEHFEVLDTDGDGELTQADDPYAPFWPGAEHVDWVGLSIYHFGAAPPWGDNELPEAGKFVDRVLGRYDGAEGDATAVPDFHATYADGEGKPFAIAETSALFVPERANEGAAEADIKFAWAEQLFAADVPEQLPELDLIVWFEHVKPEETVPDVTSSWAVSQDGQVVDAFRATWPEWLEFADGADATDG